jgi:hypothetical protein
MMGYENKVRVRGAEGTAFGLSFGMCWGDAYFIGLGHKSRNSGVHGVRFEGRQGGASCKRVRGWGLAPFRFH